MEKFCPACEDTKDETEFNWRVTNVRRNDVCRLCSRAKSKKHYKKNPEYFYKRNKRIKLEMRKELYRYLLDKSCKCGETRVAALDFHHRDSTAKLFDISGAVKDGRGRKQIWDEIAKCDIICSNCHREITALELGWYKSLID